MCKKQEKQKAVKIKGKAEFRTIPASIHRKVPDVKTIKLLLLSTVHSKPQRL